jgi:hypothetical protein
MITDRKGLFKIKRRHKSSLLASKEAFGRLLALNRKQFIMILPQGRSNLASEKPMAGIRKPAAGGFGHNPRRPCGKPEGGFSGQASKRAQKKPLTKLFWASFLGKERAKPGKTRASGFFAMNVQAKRMPNVSKQELCTAKQKPKPPVSGKGLFWEKNFFPQKPGNKETAREAPQLERQRNPDEIFADFGPSDDKGALGSHFPPPGILSVFGVSQGRFRWPFRAHF